MKSFTVMGSVLLSLGLTFLGCTTITTRSGFFEGSNGQGKKTCNPVSGGSRKTHTPRIESISPVVGFDNGGVPVMIQGRGFRPGMQVFFDDTPCENLNFIGESSVSCISPKHAQGRFDLTIVNPDGRCDLQRRGFEYVPGFQVMPKSIKIRAGEKVAFKVQGGLTPIFYALLEGAGQVDPRTGVFISANPPGTVKIRVTDARGVSEVSVIEVMPALGDLNRPSFVLTASSDQVAEGDSLYLSVAGGVGPYRYTADSRYAIVDDATGRLTAVRKTDDLLVTVHDVMGYETSVHVKVIQRLKVGQAERVEMGKSTQIRPEGGIPPYTFAVASGAGQVDSSGNFTASQQTGNTVVMIKDSVGNSIQTTVMTVPSLSIYPTQVESKPGDMLRFVALGGYTPHTFYVTGLGQIDPSAGFYTAPEVGSDDVVEVRDARGSVAKAKVKVVSQVVPRRLSLGLNHSCAIYRGVLKCWGENQWGQLGDGTVKRRLRATPVKSLGNHVASVGLGYRHTCVLMGSGAVKCWGDNSKGQLGVRSVKDRGGLNQTSNPTDVLGLKSNAVAIAVGQFHTCALADGKVYCWGDNSKGQLGSSLHGMSTLPVQVSDIPSGATAITAGSFHTCAIVNGGAKCWGWNASGQLGNRTRIDSESPVDVYGLNEGVRLLETKGNHTCAVSDKGFQCWGFNASGQLGNRKNGDRTLPTTVEGLDGEVQEIAVGQQHTCVRLSVAPKIRCWGYNHSGQVGRAGGGIQFAPFEIELPDFVDSVASGVDHTCVLAGPVYSCWGKNFNGQLGDQTTKNRVEPSEPQALN